MATNEVMWDHKLTALADSPSEMDKIDSSFVEQNWKTTSFVRFCFFNARCVSQTPMEGINKIKANGGEFSKTLHPSDISYLVTQRVNNKEKWMDAHRTEEEDKGDARGATKSDKKSPSQEAKRGREVLAPTVQPKRHR